MEQEVLESWFAGQLSQHKVYGIGNLVPKPGGAQMMEPVVRLVADSGRRFPILVHGEAPQALQDFKDYAGIAKRYPTVPIIIGQTAGAFWLGTMRS